MNMPIEGARETLRAFRRLPKEASQELRDRSQKLSETLATRARQAAQSDSPQAALMASTIKARRDRLPSLQVGGSKRVGRNKAPAYKILFGAEFGSNSLAQFRPHNGQQGYWFFPVAENQSADIRRAWQDVADEIERRFTADDIGGGS
ncbi:hypothetical protein BJF85_16740 [Saccharomonospora sp. CUA-673]|nr:hypothetical protein BJF85_16740 [Saccharomonospora sp. CUA-673]